MKRLNEFKRRKGAEPDPDELESDDASGGGNGGGGGSGAGGAANKSDRVQAGGVEQGEMANAAGGATAGVGGGRDPQVQTFPDTPVF